MSVASYSLPVKDATEEEKNQFVFLRGGRCAAGTGPPNLTLRSGPAHPFRDLLGVESKNSLCDMFMLCVCPDNLNLE